MIAVNAMLTGRWHRRSHSRRAFFLFDVNLGIEKTSCDCDIFLPADEQFIGPTIVLQSGRTAPA